MANRVSLLINSCDAYGDVLSSQLRILGYFNYINDHFDKIYVNTESLNYTGNLKGDAKIHFLQNNCAYWGERLINSLKEIETEFVFVLFDDYFPETEFCEQLINLTTEFLSTDGSDCAILSPVLSLEDNCTVLSSNFRLVPKNSLYRINSAPAIWKTKSLISTLSREDDPWVWECFSMYRKNARALRIVSVDKNSKLQYRYSYHTGGAVYRGSWVESALSSYTDEIRSLIAFGSRPIISSIESKPRSLSWKMNLLITGLKSSGIGALHFFIASLLVSLKKKYSR